MADYFFEGDEMLAYQPFVSYNNGTECIVFLAQYCDVLYNTVL